MKKILCLITAFTLLAFIAGCMGSEGIIEKEPVISGPEQAESADLEPDEGATVETASEETAQAETAKETEPAVQTTAEPDKCAGQTPVSFPIKSQFMKEGQFSKECVGNASCSFTVSPIGGSGEYDVKFIGLPDGLTATGMGFQGMLTSKMTSSIAIIVSDKECPQNYIVAPLLLTVSGIIGS